MGACLFSDRTCNGKSCISSNVNAGEAELIDYTQSSGSPSPFPLMKCRNIYVLPGIPKLLQEKWKVHCLACYNGCVCVCVCVWRKAGCGGGGGGV